MKENYKNWSDSILKSLKGLVKNKLGHITSKSSNTFGDLKILAIAYWSGIFKSTRWFNDLRLMVKIFINTLWHCRKLIMAILCYFYEANSCGLSIVVGFKDFSILCYKIVIYTCFAASIWMFISGFCSQFLGHINTCFVNFESPLPLVFVILCSKRQF